MRTPSSCFDLRLVRRAHRHPAVVEQRVARVDQHRRLHAARAAQDALRSRDERAASRGRCRSRRRAARRSGRGRSTTRRAIAIRTCSGIGPRAARSTRTTCCLAEWTPPARIRVLVGVVRPRWRDDVADVDPLAHRLEQPPARLVLAGDADGDRAATERGDVVRGVARRRPARFRSSRIRGSAPALRATRARSGRR